MDGPWGSDPAFFVIWSRFRQFRQYLPHRPDEEDCTFRLLDYASTGSPGHGPIHLLVDSDLEIGLSLDSEQVGWIRFGLPPLRMMARFSSSAVPFGNLLLTYARRKGFGVSFVFIFMAVTNFLLLLTGENETKCC